MRTTSVLVASLLLCLAAGCGNSDNNDAGAGHDLSAGPDLTMPGAADQAVPHDLAAAPGDLAAADDLATPPDQAKPVDLAGATGCQDDRDCRLFSSYCDNAPCVCVALSKDQPDPPCLGKMVTCLFDPCMKHTTTCDKQTGHCLLQ